jgi:hypothetical protein
MSSDPEIQGPRIPDPDPRSMRSRGIQELMLTGLREYGHKHRDPEQLDALGLDRRTRGPEVRTKQQPERAYTPNQSCAMVSKRDPGIHGSGDYPRREIPRPAPRTEGVGHGVWRYPRCTVRGVRRTRTLCPCVLVHTYRPPAPQLVEMWSVRDPGSGDPGILVSGIMTRETSRG